METSTRSRSATPATTIRAQNAPARQCLLSTLLPLRRNAVFPLPRASRRLEGGAHVRIRRQCINASRQCMRWPSRSPCVSGRCRGSRAPGWWRRQHSAGTARHKPCTQSGDDAAAHFLCTAAGAARIIIPMRTALQRLRGRPAVPLRSCLPLLPRPRPARETEQFQNDFFVEKKFKFFRVPPPPPLHPFIHATKLNYFFVSFVSTHFGLVDRGVWKPDPVRDPCEVALGAERLIRRGRHAPQRPELGRQTWLRRRRTTTTRRCARSA